MRKIIPLLMLSVFSYFTAKTQNSPAVSLGASIDILSGDYCFGGYGAVRANAFGGVPPYTYQWSVGPNTQILSGLSAGTYDVTITDNVGATATATNSISNASV